MKKLIAFSMTITAMISMTAAPATAQYYDAFVATDKPSVEIDLSVLDESAAPSPSEPPVRLVYPTSTHIEQMPLISQPLALSPEPEAVSQYMLAPPARLLKPSPDLAQKPAAQNETATAFSPQPLLSKPPLKPREIISQSEPDFQEMPIAVLEHTRQQEISRTVAPSSEPLAPTTATLTVPPQATQQISKPEPHTPAPSARAVPRLSDLTLMFEKNSSDITASASEKLDAIVMQLTENQSLRLQLRAYATGEDGGKTSARRISLARALAVRSYLMDNGIGPTRVDVRALGMETNQKPLDRVELVFIGAQR